MKKPAVVFIQSKWYLLMCFAFCSFAVLAQAQESNDHIFPPAAAAKPFIDFDSKGFIINGKRTFLVSAGLEYARIPHELWHDRLLRLKRDGFDCIEIYTFWNFHEPQEGKFSFSGDCDLNLFLQEVHALDMYAIVRVGPYYCAEWVNGGYPEWLRFKPDVKVREDNPAFMKCADNFFDTLYPIVFKQQINHGGPVVLVQLENEHTKGWGTTLPNGYFHHLQDKALALGLQVPYFFSGLHHSSDPAGEGHFPLDDSTRHNPWMSTEFWSVWYDKYNSDIKEAKKYERRTWKIIAHGGNGYNYYMAHGGTNFGYTNNNEDAASYDYGSAVGQAGDLRPMYYSFKKMGWFARSFQNILENSSDATDIYKSAVTDKTVKEYARHSEAGDIIFIDNPSAVAKQILFSPVDNTIPISNVLNILPNQIYPVIHNFKLSNNITLNWCTAQILGIAEQGNITSFVVYGDAGSSANMIFSTAGTAKITKGGTDLFVNEKKVQLKVKPVEDIPAEYSFTSNGKTIRIFVVSTALADRTWFAEYKNATYIIFGPSYVGDIKNTNGHLFIDTEEPWSNVKDMHYWTYDSVNEGDISMRNSGDFVHQQSIPLTSWQSKDAAIFAAANYDDAQWKKSEEPLQMGADGDLTADAWYRTTVTIDTAGSYSLDVLNNDRVTPFVDGVLAGKQGADKEEIAYNFTKGKHTLAFFTAHNGLDKFAGYIGPIDNIDQKGLFGVATLKKGNSQSVISLTDWYFIKANEANDVHKGEPSPELAGWKKYTIGEDAFARREGFGWFRTTIPRPPLGTTKLQLKFKSTDEDATIFINGKRTAVHKGWNQPFTVAINYADVKKWPVELAVFIENYNNIGGIDGAVHVNYIGVSMPFTGWRMKGGTGDIAKLGDWKNLDSIAQKGRPAFYQSTFTIKKSEPELPVWRVITTSLGHGSVWVNGHNLGRYPEKVAAPGMYIPECWLKEGTNTLLIFDEDGKSPASVEINAEAQAGRMLGRLDIK